MTISYNWRHVIYYISRSDQASIFPISTVWGEPGSDGLILVHPRGAVDSRANRVDVQKEGQVTHATRIEYIKYVDKADLLQPDGTRGDSQAYPPPCWSTV